MKKRWAVAIAVAASAGLLALMNAGAATVPVQMDPSFGTDGRTIVDIGGPGASYEDEPFSLVMQPDGKFVTAGKARNPATGNFDFAVLRYTANGQLDASFGWGGIVLTDFQRGYDEGLSVALQSDGKIVVAGRADRTNGQIDFALVRLNANGSRDTTFGWGGLVMTDLFGAADNATSIAVQPDGKIVAAGFGTRKTTDKDFALVRYNPNGSRDAGFGWGGLVSLDFSGRQDVALKVLLQPDGKIVATGMAESARGAGFDFALARFGANGSRDASFGWRGIVTKDIQGFDDVGYTSLLQPDGKIVVGGLTHTSSTAQPDAALARFNANGGLDTAFATYGAPGVVTTDIHGDYDQILSLALQPDGKIFAVGHSVHPVTGFDFALYRYEADGDLDATLGNGGYVTQDLFGGPDGLHGVVLQADGKAVATGDTYHPAAGSDDFVIERLLVADPSWIAGVVSSMAASAFASASGRDTLLSELAAAEAELAADDAAAALSRLVALRTHVDGCTAPEDYIIDCGQQSAVLTLLDQVIARLGGP